MESQGPEDDTALHQELLEGAHQEFPLESFLVMRRSGLSVEESLEALDYDITELTFQQRAALAVDPTDEEQLRALLQY